MCDRRPAPPACTAPALGDAFVAARQILLPTYRVLLRARSGPGGPPPPPPMGMNSGIPPPPGLGQPMSLMPPMPLPLMGMSGGLEALQSGGGVGGIPGPFQPPGQPMADMIGVAPAAKGPKPLRIPPEGKAQPRACGAPIAKRTLAELKADEKKTGIKVPEDLPPDFPRGPWVVDMTKPPDHVPATGAHDGGVCLPLRAPRAGPLGPDVCGCNRMEVPRGADGGAVEVLVLGPEHAARRARP